MYRKYISNELQSMANKDSLDSLLVVLIKYWTLNFANHSSIEELFLGLAYIEYSLVLPQYTVCL